MRVLRCAQLEGPRLRHGFFGRSGGVSGGVYAGLNCGPGSGDDRAAVIENRRRAVAELGGNALVTCYQIHSADCVTVTAAWDIGAAPQADAMVTNVAGLALGILTADCAPVLLADSQAGVIGAAHAGWKGAIAGVTDAVVSAMERLGAERRRIAAAVGPCIAQASYEVDGTFRDRFLAADAGNGAFFRSGARHDHYHFDLEGYVVQRLAAAGVNDTTPMQTDTYADDAAFFSYRRACHRGEQDYGRDLSAILLR